ncbi:MAG: DUF192 domain-containing protein [Endomicrobia bacterium]|nr:DUF192 domain-containing protein [Endomicrobiia bacterium]MCX7940680.1 DUF192 domain-containing protein [Endomicrobiia bacterium]
MKKKILIFVPILVIVILFILFVKKLLQPEFKIVRYELNGKIYSLYLADTPRKWEQGLMYKKRDDLLRKGIDGMLFVFPDVKQRMFYNKNTYVDLDIYWIKDDKIIDKTFLPSIKTSGRIVYILSPGEVDKVVELLR